jgi:hypothetical protein
MPRVRKRERVREKTHLETRGEIFIRARADEARKREDHAAQTLLRSIVPVDAL